MSEAVLNCRDLKRSFKQGAARIKVLEGVDLVVKKGEKIAILGASGSGKSTLLHLLGGLDRPDSGEIEIIGQDILAMSSDKLARFRNRHIGFVYQFHHLLPEFNALDNVSIPLWIGKTAREEASAQARHILAKIGLERRLNHRPSELSGGERQRVAIARAMVSLPDIILADEPTGNLDGKAVQNVMDIFDYINRENNTALLIVTHDERIASAMDRIYTIADHGIKV